MECTEIPAGVRKAKKKQVKDELDRIKQAEKKKRRLEKALATSAAIRSELEKKKLKKKEEQEKLDEEGAAMAEAVALHVLLGENSDDSCKVMLKKDEELTTSLDNAADIFLWRDKKISAGVLGVATTIWVFFELLEYHLLTLVCHILILALAILFLWSNGSVFINKSPPRIPEVIIPEDFVLGVASALRIVFNRALAILRDIASGRDLKQFLAAIAGLWVLSVLGSCWNSLTFFYIGFVFLHTVPVLYEKYEDQVDAFAEKAEAEIKKQCAVFNEKVLSKIPKGSLKDKKLA